MTSCHTQSDSTTAITITTAATHMLCAQASTLPHLQSCLPRRTWRLPPPLRATIIIHHSAPSHFAVTLLLRFPAKLSAACRPRTWLQPRHVPRAPATPRPPAAHLPAPGCCTRPTAQAAGALAGCQAALPGLISCRHGQNGSAMSLCVSVRRYVRACIRLRNHTRRWSLDHAPYYPYSCCALPSAWTQPTWSARAPPQPPGHLCCFVRTRQHGLCAKRRRCCCQQAAPASSQALSQRPCRRLRIRSGRGRHDKAPRTCRPGAGADALQGLDRPMQTPIPPPTPRGRGCKCKGGATYPSTTMAPVAVLGACFSVLGGEGGMLACECAANAAVCFADAGVRPPSACMEQGKRAACMHASAELTAPGERPRAAAATACSPNAA